ncbi:D-alanyl-D-alanine carboxypeptidase family protein [Blautia sp. MSJ-19]|uniref:D-alanyl-D-alanine carboxypeptidase family protein n=1 Tax=Blautia sp. MSJ-19 TaxID=2841517 RepID=UPI00209DDB5E|nr:serine hydrolase [Blautia sp. MSJ-19]
MTKRQSAKRRKQSAKMRRMRQKRVKATILLLGLLVLLTAGAGGLFYVLRGGLGSEPVQAYSISREFQHQNLTGNGQRAKAFAADLCVVSGDQELDTVSLEQGQEGVLLDLKDQSVLYAKGAYDRVYPASITKIITALLAFKNSNMDDVVTISQENITLEEGSQVVGFQEGDQVTMDQLVHCLLVYSGNDAASAIATHVGGSTENFVAMMNEYAAQLGCTGTHFTNPHGLQDENHYTTPYDIYLMLKEALNYPEFTEITQLPSYTVTFKHSDGSEESVALTATDHYLTGEANTPKGVTILGGKTGTTSSAGNCLALLSQNSYGSPYISIVMGASSKELLYQQMTSLLNHINTGTES